ncbi:hypothetical protein GG804_25630 [Sphingomonas histidinilytica]|uniref:hypothetical protein n=1 Tax=Rhizorhabdus histidinilytica TaxID=439228 RepID=UPI001ADC507D|nr:hypothetical protein [Rhizorhabdus histidinilytica]MBO9380153.1 hypothetical protein [Rhizorhabdus histidinilytica]
METVLAQLITAGPLGVFVVFLIIDRQRADKLAAAERDRRDKLDAARIETDRDLATSLATLATLIQGLGR